MKFIQNKVRRDFFIPKIYCLLLFSAFFQFSVRAANDIDGQQVILSTAAANNIQATVQQNNRAVTGTVSDNFGDPLPGVAIAIKGTSQGVASDINGEFSLTVPSDETVLVFTYIGYTPVEVEVGTRRVITVTMAEDATQLEEFVVSAFGTQRAQSVVSSITTVNTKNLQVPSSNLTTAFAGQIAGVIAYQRSGEPGQDSADFFIRGVTTFGTGMSSPLILIDNVELTAADLARMNPDDIASFSILKDAAATALYGARGANGVILVSTKEGVEGPVKVSARLENSFSSATRHVETASPLSFMKLHNEAVRTRDPLAPLPYFESEIAAREAGWNPMVYPMVDWREMLFKNYTMNQRGNMSLSGGGSVARYFVAINYSRDNGLLKVDPINSFNNDIRLEKYGVRSNVNLKLTRSTDLAIRVTGNFEDYQGPLQGGADMYRLSLRANPVRFPATFAPDAQFRHLDNVLFGNFGTGNFVNPYAEMLKGYRNEKKTAIIAQLELRQDLGMILEGLRWRLMGSTTRNSTSASRHQYEPMFFTVDTYDRFDDTYTLTALNPRAEQFLRPVWEPSRVTSAIYAETALNYDQVFNGVHNLGAMLVGTAREEYKDELTFFLYSSLPYRNLGLAGRVSYGYDDRYFVEGNFGYNGSERFAANNRWGFFPSAGAGWILSNESFYQGTKVADIMQTFKLKASYGMVGNDAISNNERFFYLSNVLPSSRGYTFGYDFNERQNGFTVLSYGNDQIGWEISYKMNLGLESTLFNALRFNVDYFTERRTNILQTRANIPALLGFFNDPRANLGEAKGRGIDGSVDYSKFFNKDFWVTVRGNFTYASSRFSYFEEPDYSATPWRSRVGSKISQQYGLIAERLFIDEDDVRNSPQQMFGNYMAGDIKYMDINGDGVIDARDMVPIGYPTTPEIIYGFGISSGYKAFDFSCFFQGSARSSFWIDAAAITPFVNSVSGAGYWGSVGNNAVLKCIEVYHWSEAIKNSHAQWPRLSAAQVSNNNQRSTWFMQNGAFLRLKSAEIGYRIPNSIAEKINATDARLYVSGTNLFVISPFKLWDPEMGGNGLGYPIQRVINIGLQVSF
jgi:TonB-linked SusC/RagA family outer membrane protein